MNRYVVQNIYFKNNKIKNHLKNFFILAINNIFIFKLISIKKQFFLSIKKFYNKLFYNNRNYYFIYAQFILKIKRKQNKLWRSVIFFSLKNDLIKVPLYDIKKTILIWSFIKKKNFIFQLIWSFNFLVALRNKNFNIMKVRMSYTMTWLLLQTTYLIKKRKKFNKF